MFEDTSPLLSQAPPHIQRTLKATSGPAQIRHCLTTISSPAQCPDVVTDFTARYAVSSVNWYKHWYNKDLQLPLFWLPHKIRLLLPGVKLLMTLRDPTQRLFSSYRFFEQNSPTRSVEEFDRLARGQMRAWKRCVQNHGTKKCLFDIPGESHLNKLWRENSTDQIRMGLYSLYIREWLKVFPRNQILFINFDHFVSSPLNYTTSHVLPFLGLAPYGQDMYQELRVREEGIGRGEKYDGNNMAEETRDMLDGFYRPYNQELAELLEDRSYAWDQKGELSMNE